MFGYSIERPEFDRDQSAWRDHTKPNANTNTSGASTLALRNRATVSEPNHTTASSSQAPGPLRWYPAENVGPTPAPVIPVESTPRTPVRQGRVNWGSSKSRTASNRWNWHCRGAPRGRPPNPGNTGNFRSTAPLRTPDPNISWNWRSQNRGTATHTQPNQNLASGNREQTLGWD